MKQIIKKLRHTLSPLRRSLEINVLGRLAPKYLTNMLYKRQWGHDIRWDNPIDIDEKINWLKFYSDTSKWATLTDKYRVRKHLESLGLGEYLPILYGKWDRAEDIDWESLPQQFVMKVNNGSGQMLLCKDKASLDTVSWTKNFKQQLKEKFGYQGAELHYNKILPCIIAEELLDNTKQPIESSSLIDYKIWSFNGKPAYIWTCHNRANHSCEVKVYDLDWKEHPEYSVDCEHYRLSHITIPRPKSLDRMLQIASTLSKGFPAVRVDLYEVDGKPYFGEMTFTSNAGNNYFYTDEFRNILGSKVDLGTNH